MQQLLKNFKRGIATFVSSGLGCIRNHASSKPPHSDAGPNLIKTVSVFEEGKLPVNLPDSDGLRLVADYLEFLIPAADALTLVRARDYTAAHELAGVYEAIQTVREIADQMDELNRHASVQEGAVP